MTTRTSLIALATILLATATPAGAVTRYVSTTGSATPPYTNEADAARSIQVAIDACSNGDRVMILPGTYYECFNFRNRDIEMVSRFEESGDPAFIEQTVLDGGLSNSVVIITNGQTTATRLSGFTIQNGWARGPTAYGNCGGGIRVMDASPRFENLVIQDNRVDGQGGGIYSGVASPLLRNVIIRGNRGPGTGGGGGIRASYGTLSLVNVAIVSNESQSGGGVFLYHGTPSLRNCLIVDNVATGEGGGAMYFDGASPQIVNCTIANNRASGDGEGGGLNVSFASQPRLINCIVWSNWPQQAYFNDKWGGQALNIEYSDFQGGTTGVVTQGKGPVNWVNSIIAEPCFAGARDYHLTSNSPCINIGTNQAWMSSETDLDGEARIVQDVVDLGPYEFPNGVPPGPTGPLTHYVSPAGANVAPYTNWAAAAHRIQDAIDVASHGAKVIVGTNRYVENIDFKGKNIAVESLFVSTTNPAHIAQTIIDGGGVSQVVCITNKEASAALTGFTLINGRTRSQGSSQRGGGILCFGSTSVLSHLVITGCSAQVVGGGMHFEHAAATVRHVVVSGNVVTQQAGGGISIYYANVLVEHARIENNRAPLSDGGGFQIYHANPTLRNILLANNAAGVKGGGLFFDDSDAVMENMTIVGNTAARGHALNVSYSSAPTLRNCIVWSGSDTNTIVFDTSLSGMSLKSYYSDVRGGLAGIQTYGKGPVTWVASTDADPVFVGGGDYRLAASSPCINTGTNQAWMASATDLAAMPRVIYGTVDMGAYEYQEIEITVTTPSAPQPGTTNRMTGDVVPFSTGGSTASDAGPVQYRFDWGDGSTSAWGDGSDSHAWSAAGTYLVRAQANRVGSPAVSAWSGAYTMSVVAAPPQTHYVSPGGSNIPPYTSWITAAHRIQDAIDVATDGAKVIVGPSRYAENISFRGKSITVESLYASTTNEAHIAQTIIDGGGVTHAVAITNREARAALSGFTIINGRADGAGMGQRGGGVCCFSSTSVLSHLVITGCTARVVGAGMHFECSSATVRHVVVSGNVVTQQAGGGVSIYYSQLLMEHARVENNRAPRSDGGGFQIYHSNPTLRNILLANNTAGVKGGGLFFDDSDAVMENMTIVGNTAARGDALNVSYSSAPTLRNSIAWGATDTNTIVFDTSWFSMSLIVDHSDVRGGLAGIQTYGMGPVTWVASLSDDPQFLGGGDYRLTAASPCINAGVNQGWMAGATDLDGMPRVAYGTVDLGAFEFQETGVTVTTPLVPATAEGTIMNGIPATFVTGGSAASDAGPVQYRFAWDDGTLSDWGAGTDTHVWSGPGQYLVRAQANRAGTPACSAWSDPFTLTVTKAPPRIRYVSHQGAAILPYTNWAIAARRVQDAVNASDNGDWIVIQTGTYYECVNFLNRDIVMVSRFEESGDPAFIEQTVLDGGLSNSVIIITNGQTTATRLSGFTIQNGWARGPTAYGNCGGGIRVMDASPRFENLVIQDNRVDGQGGGIYSGVASPSLRNVIIRGNRGPGTGGGGGIRASYGTLSLVNVAIVSNESQSGGGVFLYHGTPSLRNCLIVDNVATGEGGGAMYFDGASPQIVNCTIANNRATGAGIGGGLHVSYQSHPKLVNSILWGNTPQQVHFNTKWYGMAVSFEYTDLQDGTAGVVTLGKGPANWLAGSITNNPLFTGAADYDLASGSPCRDTGLNQSWMTGASDVVGNPRIHNGIVDMGAIEYTPEPEPLGRVTVTIVPAEARQAGAAWRLTTGADTDWKNSGDIVCNLQTGCYTVAFRELDGWSAPAEIPVGIVGGEEVSLSGVYEPVSTDDLVPPAIVGIWPPDGYVTVSNKLWMTIVATDNVAMAWVRVNGDLATQTGTNTYTYEVKPLNGHYHLQTIVAADAFGNRTTTTVIYAQSVKIRLTAIWNGYWRVRNPFDKDFPYIWEVKQNPAENGSGICPANSDDFFNTTMGAKHVVLMDTNRNIIDEKGWSPLDPPEGGAAPAFVDSDLDGVLNIYEDIAGTDAENGDDVLVFREMQSGGAMPGRVVMDAGDDAEPTVSALVFSWDSNTNTAYTLETSTNVTRWTTVQDFMSVPGTGETMSYTNPARSVSQFFLRIWAGRR